MGYRLRFQRPDALGFIANLFVENDAATAAQIRHLKAAGYTIIETFPAPETEQRFPQVQPSFSRTL
jgi:hypothetical protein